MVITLDGDIFQGTVSVFQQKVLLPKHLFCLFGSISLLWTEHFYFEKVFKCIQLKAKSMKLSRKSGNWDVHKVYSSLIKTMLDDLSFGRFSVVDPLLHLKMSFPQQIWLRNLSFLETLQSAVLLQLYFLTDFLISYQTKNDLRYDIFKLQKNNINIWISLCIIFPAVIKFNNITPVHFTLCFVSRKFIYIFKALVRVFSQFFIIKNLRVSNTLPKYRNNDCNVAIL